MRFKQLAYRTEQAYIDWIRRFILWSGKRHPREMGAIEVRGFLTHLAHVTIKPGLGVRSPLDCSA
jgi:hypothetical protein